MNSIHDVIHVVGFNDEHREGIRRELRRHTYLSFGYLYGVTSTYALKRARTHKLLLCFCFSLFLVILHWGSGVFNVQHIILTSASKVVVLTLHDGLLIERPQHLRIRSRGPFSEKWMEARILSEELCVAVYQSCVCAGELGLEDGHEVYWLLWLTWC